MRRYRSFFWPAVLILVGLVALLVNTGQLPFDRLYRLLDLWPLILIVIGVELILRRRVHGTAGDVGTALIVILAIVFAAAYVTAVPSPSATHSFEASTDVGNLSRATLEIDVGAATVTLSGSSDLGSSLYHARVEYSGAKPRITLDHETGKLRIDQPSTNAFTFQSRRFVLNLELNPAIPWTITQNSGAATDTIKVPHLHLAALTLNTGAGRDEVTLGAPSGIVPIQVNGGSLTVRVHRPPATAVSVAVSGGAVTLSLDGRNRHAIGQAGDQSSGFGSAADGYRIQVNGGACNVTVDTAGESG
jgi:hypothetical protein